jgi:DNA polymerase-1
MSRHLIIDGDINVYKISVSACTELETEDGIVAVAMDRRQAECMIDVAMAEMQDIYKAKKVSLVLSDKGPKWRNSMVDPNYKANRVKRKPIGYWKLCEYMVEKYGAISYPGLEGDDVIGILATDPALRKKGLYPLIISTDKDMKTLPDVEIAASLDQKPIVNSELDSWYHHMFQTLTGDSADGYKGCRGIGKVKAEAILEGYGSLYEMWAEVVATYEGQGMTFEDALRNARLAHILQHGEYNHETAEVKLWNPPV